MHNCRLRKKIRPVTDARPPSARRSPSRLDWIFAVELDGIIGGSPYVQLAGQRPPESSPFHRNWSGGTRQLASNSGRFVNRPYKQRWPIALCVVGAARPPPNHTVSTHPPPRRIAVQAGAPTEMHHQPSRVSCSGGWGVGGGSPPRRRGFPKGRAFGPSAAGGIAGGRADFDVPRCHPRPPRSIETARGPGGRSYSEAPCSGPESLRPPVRGSPEGPRTRILWPQGSRGPRQASVHRPRRQAQK